MLRAPSCVLLIPKPNYLIAYISYLYVNSLRVGFRTPLGWTQRCIGFTPTSHLAVMPLSRGEHRTKVLEEICKTEGDYLAGLQMVQEV